MATYPVQLHYEFEFTATAGVVDLIEKHSCGIEELKPDVDNCNAVDAWHELTKLNDQLLISGGLSIRLTEKRT
jgi:hypothetical protein